MVGRMPSSGLASGGKPRTRREGLEAMKNVHSNSVSSEQVERMVASHGDFVAFGEASDAVSEAWLNSAESRLGVKFSLSYRWFLRRYNGGEICGEEVFSVYGIDFDSVSGGDIVHQHQLDVSSGLMPDLSLVVSRTGLGEVFYFDYTMREGDEVPIRLRVPSGESVHYASDFCEFLVKRISSYL